MTVTPNAYRLADDILTVETDEETVIMGYASGKYFGVRGAIRHVLGNLRRSSTLEEMTGDIAAHFAVPVEAVRKDLEEIVPRLMAAGIVVDSASPQ